MVDRAYKIKSTLSGFDEEVRKLTDGFKKKMFFNFSCRGNCLALHIKTQKPPHFSSPSQNSKESLKNVITKDTKKT